MTFELDPVLRADTLALASSSLCDIRLMNDARFPWLILVPRRAGAVEILDLERADQDALWAEIRAAAEALRSACRPDKLNIAALGNQVSQLHVHIVARFRKDPAWPAPVWGHGPARPYGPDDDETIGALARALETAR